MGMFDYLECRHPLPGNVPDWAKINPLFQTKDLECELATRIITVAGTLEGSTDFTGTIDFYNDNVVARGPGIYTANGEDAWSVEYRAVFVAGKIASLTETENERRPAAKPKWRKQEPLSAEDLKIIKKRREESLVGKRIFLWWGGQPSGDYVTVIAENASELVCEGKDGNFQTMPRHLRDTIFFDSEAEGVEYVKAKKDAWERERQEFEAEIAGRPPGEVPA